jgi:hypothetical protein
MVGTASRIHATFLSLTEPSVSPLPKDKEPGTRLRGDNKIRYLILFTGHIDAVYVIVQLAQPS